MFFTNHPHFHPVPLAAPQVTCESRPATRGLAPEWRATSYHVTPARSSERIQVLFHTINIISVSLSLSLSLCFYFSISVYLSISLCPFYVSRILVRRNEEEPAAIRITGLYVYVFSRAFVSYVIRVSRICRTCACIASVFA